MSKKAAEIAAEILEVLKPVRGSEADRIAREALEEIVQAA
jgi:hypothetical protein